VGGTPPLNLTIRAPMFSLNDSLFVVNVIKDSLLVYDPKGCFSGSRPFDFHKTIVLGVPEYINFDFLTDPVGSAVYVVDHRNFNYRIARLDPATGRTGQPVPLPDLPGMSRITTYAGAIYFLYQEKKFPYYTRLYRYQL
jgi:DNA-binding beta-propeller fold protein YncE